MNRKEHVFAKYKAEWNAEFINGEELLQQTIENFAQQVPGNNKYLEWMIKQATDSPFKEEAIIRIVIDFHNNQNELTANHVLLFETNYGGGFTAEQLCDMANASAKPRDINAYSIWLLQGVLDTLLAEKYKRQQIKMAERQFDVILDNEEYFIAVPLTHAASQRLGHGTKWCTAMADNDAHFQSYTREGTLYYVCDRIRTDPEYPLYKFAYYRKFINTYGDTYNAPDCSVGDIRRILPMKFVDLIEQYHAKQFNFDVLFQAINEYVNNASQSDLVELFESNQNNPPQNPPLMIKYGFSAVNSQIIVNLPGFKDWTYVIYLCVTNIQLSHIIQLHYKNNPIEDNNTLIYKYSSSEILPSIRNLMVNTITPMEAVLPILSAITKNLLQCHWRHCGMILYEALKFKCLLLCNNKWIITPDTEFEDFIKYGVFTIKIQNQDPKSHCGKLIFHGEFSIDDFIQAQNKMRIQYGLNERQNARYVWPKYRKKGCCKFTQDSVLKLFTTFVNATTKYIISTKHKRLKSMVTEDSSLRQSLWSWVNNYTDADNNDAKGLIDLISNYYRIYYDAGN